VIEIIFALNNTRGRKDNARIVRNRFSGPKALEDLERGLWKLSKMSVDDFHMQDAGGERCQVVMCDPRGAGIGSWSLDTDFGNDRFGTFLGVREDFCEKRKRSRCKNKPVRKESF
jgi:hypothetical protein